MHLQVFNDFIPDWPCPVTEIHRNINNFTCNSVKIFVIQLTLVISKLKGPSETLRDIRSST